MEKKSLYNDDVYASVLERIESLSAATRPNWGVMTAAQMLGHCSSIQEVSNGAELKGTPLLVKLIKKVVRDMVSNAQPYKHNVRTHPQYVQSGDRDFDTEKRRLLSTLERTIRMTQEEEKGIVHPLFGPMSRDEKGWIAYKHIDHHLTQFGA